MRGAVKMERKTGNMDSPASERGDNEDTGGFLERELVRMKGRLTMAERESVNAVREASVLKKELSMAKEEMDRLGSELGSFQIGEDTDGSPEASGLSSSRRSKSTSKSRSLQVAALQETIAELSRELESSKVDAHELVKELAKVQDQNKILTEKIDELALSRPSCAHGAECLRGSEIGLVTSVSQEGKSDEAGAGPVTSVAIELANLKVAYERAVNELQIMKDGSRSGGPPTDDSGEEALSDVVVGGKPKEGKVLKDALNSAGSEEGEESQILHAANKRIADLEDELLQAKQENAELDEELTGLEETMSHLSEGITQKEGLQEDLAASRSKITELSGDLTRWREQTGELGDALTLAQEAIVQLTEQMSKKDKDEAASKEQLATLSEELSQWRDETANMEAYLSEAHERMTGLAEQANEAVELRKQLTASNIEVQELESALSALEQAHEELQEKAGLNGGRQNSMQESNQDRWNEEMEDQLQEVEQEKEELEEEVHEMRAENATLNARLAAASEQGSMMERMLMETENRMAEVQRRLVETHKEKLTSDMDLAVANAARSELGTRLAMAQNEIAAVTARFSAMAEAHPEVFNRETMVSQGWAPSRREFVFGAAPKSHRQPHPSRNHSHSHTDDSQASHHSAPVQPNHHQPSLQPTHRISAPISSAAELGGGLGKSMSHQRTASENGGQENENQSGPARHRKLAPYYQTPTNRRTRHRASQRHSPDYLSPPDLQATPETPTYPSQPLSLGLSRYSRDGVDALAFERAMGGQKSAGMHVAGGVGGGGGGGGGGGLGPKRERNSGSMFSPTHSTSSRDTGLTASPVVTPLSVLPNNGPGMFGGLQNAMSSGRGASKSSSFSMFLGKGKRSKAGAE